MLPGIRSGTHSRRPQRIEAGSYFGRRTPEDGTIDWSMEATTVHNLVRGVTRPFPGARTSVGGRTLFVWETRVEPDPPEPAPPGTIDLSDGLCIQTRSGRVRVLECQWAGGPRLVGPAIVSALRDPAETVPVRIL